MSNDSFRKIIDAANTGKRFPALSLIRDNAELAATISKLIPSIDPPKYSEQGNREPNAPNAQMFKNTSDRIAQNSADARTVLQILPDMELAAQILVSSILSPKDMITTELTYSLTEGLVSPDISAALIDVIKNYFETDYKIKPLLPKMLRDMLFETGSYPVAVIPENSIDELINGNHRISFEGLSDNINSDGSMKPVGLLGPAILKKPVPERKSGGLSMESLSTYSPDKEIESRVTLESFFQKPVETFLTVTDNCNLLKIPQINQKIREQRIKGMVGSKALESINISGVDKRKMNDREMTSLVYKERNFNFKPISVLKTQEQLNRRSVGNPLVLHLPSESVIPVYVPGCVEEQVGFFVLIDGDGNPISRADDADYYQQLSSRLNSNGSFPSAMLNNVKSQMNGFNPNNLDHINYSIKAYGDMVEQDLLARLRNGVYGNGVALAKNTEIYRLMFARALAKQHTQLLFVPVELMTYFAFKHTTEGIGQSLLEDMKILNSLRSMLLFANVMASLKNSIGRTEVKIKLDESDPNPQKTIETTMHEITRSRQQYFPLGLNSPTDITDWLQRSGFEFTFEGHPGLPDVSVDFGEKAAAYNKPDTELEELLRKKAIMATGLSPETVDASFQAEFATSIVTNNILLSKRVVQMQEQFMPQLTSHLRKCVMNSEKVIVGLRKVIEDNFDKLEMEVTEDGRIILDKIKDGKAGVSEKEHTATEKKSLVNSFLNEFIMNFEVSLPAPNSVTLDNQMAAMETYSKALDVSIEAWISEKFFTTENGGDIANQVSTVKEVLKAYFLRKWMSENGVMSELHSLTTLGYDGKPSVDIYQLQESHIEGLTKSLTKFMVGVSKVKEASNTVMQNIGGAGEPPTDTGSESSSSGEPDDDGSNGGEFSFDSVPKLDGEEDEEPKADAGKPDEEPKKDEGEEKDSEAKPDAAEVEEEPKV